MPVLVNAQVTSQEAPFVRRGDIELVVCAGCGHLFNRAFDPALLDYDASYENTLHYSANFRQFASGLCDRLVTTHHLVGERVAELGSGPGHFLSMLCDAGVASGLGFDPSYDAGRLGAPEHPAVVVSTGLFPADGSLQVRLAFSQHVLEHLDDPIAALAAQRSAVMSTGGVVYTEVPNGELMLHECALWDLIYEHRSYFVPTSLAVACSRAGLSVRVMDAAFGGQFLWCEAEPGDDPRDVTGEAVAAAIAAARQFGVEAIDRIASARRELESLASAGPVVLWGAGSKGITYLNLVADVAPVAAVVDINPRKTGWGVPGTTLTITSPDRLVDVRPRTVLAANPLYVDEIASLLADLDLRPDVVPLWGT
jgi:SAM-dependent methyltransferase